MIAVRPFRTGQPLMALAVVLLLWVGARAVLWESPFEQLRDVLPAITIDQSFIGSEISASNTTSRPEKLPSQTTNTRRIASVRPDFSALIPLEGRRPLRSIERFDAAASHQLLWMAALSYLPGPGEAPSPLSGSQISNFPFVRGLDDRQANTSKRWSFDGWALWRADTQPVRAFGPALPTYGASQVGAVMRYQLAPNSGHNPRAYVRVTRSLSGEVQGHAAVGVMAKPISQIPVSIAAEARLSRAGPSTEVRPAVYAVTELPRIQLPLKFTADAYAQAGYVGGNFSTAFADGQFRLEREVAALDLGKVKMGGGAWGGIQKGAKRLDVGPSASVEVKIAQAPIRLSLDYRQRVAGDAIPQSGVALTLSTGF